MYKKSLIFILITLIITFTGCNSNNYSITKFTQEPVVTTINKSEAIVKITMLVYHKDGFVTKTEMIQENVLKNGNADDLKVYSKSVEETFNNEIFNMEGFEYSFKLKDKVLAFTTTYNYTEMDIKQVLENGKELMHVKSAIDENYKITYYKLVESYIEVGFVVEKEEL
ncbi:hypothetical protein RBH29_15545 [Herbivorax sp. ANBcel31]|uniref:hypothetical protein n=1 Tax=Herbivorax sp. ANBcel31 TaxID=3069754 RepID=UPI0027B3BAFF|nr:hypothetical protein [Herbivorax sp. ANBcel31]MDQ2087845.1 hypothetical protein [Herbivorax sp. ANBcel31]